MRKGIVIALVAVLLMGLVASRDAVARRVWLIPWSLTYEKQWDAGWCSGESQHWQRWQRVWSGPNYHQNYTTLRCYHLYDINQNTGWARQVAKAHGIDVTDLYDIYTVKTDKQVGHWTRNKPVHWANRTTETVQQVNSSPSDWKWE